MVRTATLWQKATRLHRVGFRLEYENIGEACSQSRWAHPEQPDLATVEARAVATHTTTSEMIREALHRFLGVA